MRLKVSKATIVRTVLVVLMLINMGLKAAGKTELVYSENEITELVTYIINIAIIVDAFWHNNSFTKHAIMADNLLKELKNGTTGEEE